MRSCFKTSLKSTNFWLASLCVAVLGLGCNSTEVAPPYSPDQALQTFQLSPGFRIELVAAEPLIADPVAMDIDEYGRIFVAEMPGYPLDVGGTGRIKLLRDTDGDGRPDTAILFADSLRLPTGLMRWKEGVLVTDPPDLLYLADTDHDGVADERTVILTGFALSNAQHNVNKPLFGLDNWIYLANNGPIWWTEKYTDPFGDRGQELYFPADPNAARLPRNGSDRNVRLKPDALKLESLSSRSQFGQTFDPWGRHYLVDNSQHHYLEVIAERYFAGKSHIPVAQAIHRTPDQENASQVFPITHNPEHQLLTDRGVFTSACALTWYAGGLFPPPFAENVTFVAEPVHNLVHVDRVVPAGAVFAAQRIESSKEFLASTDSWFRPVNFSVGPDGALYVVDYYRQIIEHPEWMDDELAAHGDLTRGIDRGRIYRIVPDTEAPMNWHDQLDLGHLGTSELIEYFDAPNRWWRMQAQRLIVTRQDQSVADELTELASSATRAETRLHALWTLNGLNRLSANTIISALGDTDPRIRENTLILAEPFLNSDADLVDLLVGMVDDSDVRVRFQLIKTLGLVNARAVTEAVLEVLWTDIESDWMQSAALLAYTGEAEELMIQALDRPNLPEGAGNRLIMRLAALVAESDGLSPTLIRSGPRLAARLSGAGEGLQRSATRFTASKQIIQDLLSLILGNAAEEGDAALSVLRQLELPALSIEAEALAIAEDSTQNPSTRGRAVELMTLAGSSLESLDHLVANSYPAPIQLAVLKAFESRPGVTPAQMVLEKWAGLTPQIRRTALDVFNSQERAELLVGALEDGQVLPGELAWHHRVQLMRDTQEPVRSRARALLQLPPERSADELDLSAGDFEQGRNVYLTYCAQCHAAGPMGSGVMGPDLTTVQHWPKPALLREIIDPSRSISSGYEQWQLRLNSGQTVQGVVVEESPVSVTVASAGVTQTVRRDQIAEMIPLAASGMPPNLHVTMTDAELAGLLTFITEFTGAPEAFEE